MQTLLFCPANLYGFENSILVNFSIKCETLLLARYHGEKLETKHPGQ